MKLAAFFLPLGLLLAAADDPSPSPPTVIHAAGRSSGPVSPGEVIVLGSAHAGPDDLLGAQLDREGKVATTLADTRVLFDGIAAPLAYSVSGEVMAVVPYEISGRHSTQLIVEYQGRRSPSVMLDVVDSAPALFTLDSTGKGQAAILNETGCCNSTRNPAKTGSIAVLYATGEGQTTPPGITGEVSFYERVADYPVPQLPVQVTVGGEPAEIVYAGEAPHAVAGLLQVNFRVPANAPIGDSVPVTLTIGNFRSPDAVTMAVRAAVQRVLVIDPDPANRTWFQKALADASYDVSIAPSAKEALDQIGRAPIDLVILSLAISEPERLAAIRALEAAQPHIRIAVTATSLWLSPATLKAADLLGAQAVFVKPMAPKPVIARIRELLRPHPLPD